MPGKAHPRIDFLTKLRVLHHSAPIPHRFSHSRVSIIQRQLRQPRAFLIVQYLSPTSLSLSALARTSSTQVSSRSCIRCLRVPNNFVYSRHEISSRGSATATSTHRFHTKAASSRSESAHSKGEAYIPVPLKASLGNWVSIVVFGVISGALIAVTSYAGLQHGNTGDDPSNKVESEILLFDNSGEDWTNMTQETLPGRPGTLSAEQEEKLRELWVSTLNVFGVLDEGDAKELGASIQNDTTDNRQRSNTSTSEKPKKKRISLFSRKHKDHDSNSTTTADSNVTSPVEADSNDKYGQTKQFHETLAQQSPESLRATFWSMVKHDHPDALLLRFLRARKWDVQKALIMMVSTMNWIATEMHVDDDIMKEGEGGALAATKGSDPAAKQLSEDFLAQLRMGKSFLHGVDKSGRPMCVVRARLHKQGEQSEESLERYTVFVIETARMVLSPPVDTACVIFDMSGFSMANMDYGPVKFMIKCFEANYPESLGVVLVHKAPWIFQGMSEQM